MSELPEAEKMEQKTVEYTELVATLRVKLSNRYGSIAAFTRSKDFFDLGFDLRDSAKVQTYFSRKKEDGKSTKSKSAKVMAKLAKKYLNIQVEVKTITTKTQVLVLG